jgi:hypothetical protein
MEPSDSLIKPESTEPALTYRQAGVENHRKIADHLYMAAANHFKAATHLNEGDYEKAARCAIVANEYLNLVNEARKEDMHANFKFNI